MTVVNPQNERIKRAYSRYQRDALGRSEATINSALYAIASYERFTAAADFRTFDSNRAVAYRKHLLAGNGKRAAEQSLRATVHSKLMALQVFFRWLALEDGYKKSIDVRDVEFLNLTARDAMVAQARSEKPAPSLDQVRSVILAMPHTTDVQLRDRALVALVLLTGVRVKALTTLKLKHVRDDAQGISQDAREVQTKGAKTFPTFFFPVGDDVREIFQGYVRHLRLNLGFGADDPLFPSTRQTVDDQHFFLVSGLTRAHWLTTDPVRDVFRRACANAGYPYFRPHSLRKTLVELGEQRCKTAEDFKAWSQNLGHDEVLTTLTSYGAVKPNRQAEIMHTLGLPPSTDASLADELAKLLAHHQRSAG